MKRLVLASSSPRRRALLEKFGYTFLLAPSKSEEKMDPHATPIEVVQSLAQQKAEEIAHVYPNDIVLGADTVVVYNEKILGKPADEEEAKKMLNMLSGQLHTVYTGVAIVNNGHVNTFCSSTNVRFRNLTRSEINAYVQTGEPFDKAGAYGIQELGGAFVQEIQGDYMNVVGLPLVKVLEELRLLGVTGTLN
ncbi:Maf family protein [Bacillus solimangrovi]|uniref:dTTP/UTP pyrophosphatase n=1 Tax=Bacillus solimangrovi TaxID=1305675 RepID=A0A1E5LBJ7_9BACI|nr:Maf family protein [Bacillus solimangrovi]OEH91461.1 septum formation protein Maf [Bacillus solimangrovi]